MDPTINQLLDLITVAPVTTDVEMAARLGVNIDVLRWRLEDLRQRGVLKHPVKDAFGWTWASWYSTAADSGAAAQRSGLLPDTTVRQMSWWNRLRGRG